MSTPSVSNIPFAVPNEKSNNYDNRHQYYQELDPSFKRAKEQNMFFITSRNGREFLVRESTRPNARYYFNNVKTSVFNAIFLKVREMIGYLEEEWLRDVDSGSWIEDVFKAEEKNARFQFCNPIIRGSALIGDIFGRIEAIESAEEKRKAMEIKEEVEKMLDEVVQSFGYCCCRKFEFEVNNLFCTENCPIKEGEKYFVVEDTEEHFCVNHWNEFKKKSPSVLFSERSHTQSRNEKKVRCKKCWKTFHYICVQYNPLTLTHSEFLCHNCAVRERVPTSVRCLKETYSSNFIQNGIHEFLASVNLPTDVFCRLLCSIKKTGILNSYEKYHYPKLAERMNDKNSFIHKTYGIFQEVDRHCVLIFCFSVQEFSGESKKPKLGTVYLEFLDSVKFFNSPVHRKALNQKIVAMYLEHAFNMGFKSVAWYASVPEAQQEYLFNSRGAQSHNATQAQLKRWYDDAISKVDGTVAKIIEKKYLPNEKESVNSICNQLVFQNGTWFEKLESILNVPDGHKKEEFQNQVLRKQRDKENQFYVKFPTNLEKLPTDKDPQIKSEVMSSRDSFLQKQKDENWQFNSLRRARFATNMLLTSLKLEADQEDRRVLRKRPHQ
uniref:histone acetyltransferase n=1 Tax=Caenorhabditis tropicalis TaxID=1561998 RepID=A0A1I7TW74_9PELO